MEIKLLHLYHDLLNLYGEYGNINILKSHLEDQGVSVTLDNKTIGDTFNLNDYDFIYCGAGTESHVDMALEDLIKHKDELTRYIEDNKVALFTGCSVEMLGACIHNNVEAMSHRQDTQQTVEAMPHRQDTQQTVEAMSHRQDVQQTVEAMSHRQDVQQTVAAMSHHDVSSPIRNGEHCSPQSLHIFDFEVNRLSDRKTNDVILTSKLFEKEVVGFINKQSNITNNDNHLFEVKFGIGENEDNKFEGAFKNNLFATYVIGPILVRNPHVLKLIVEKIIKSKDNYFELKDIAYENEEKGYELVLNELTKRIK